MNKKKRVLVLAKCFDKQGRLLSTATNSYTKTHPIMQYLARVTGTHPGKVFLHAEVAAILRAKDHAIHTLTIERYHKDGTPASAAPCPMCSHYISMMGIKRVIHT